MERKKPAPPPSSSSDEGSSTEGEESEQGFVRSDRKAAEFEDKKAQIPVAAEEDDSDEEEEDEEEDDDDHHDGGAVDSTQRGRAREAASSSDTTQAGHGPGDSNSGSETSSASKGKPAKSSHLFVVIPRKAENANGHGKKTPVSEKPSKVRPTSETLPKKFKDKVSKRDRDAELQEKGSSKKRKKESSSKPSKAEKASKEKSTPGDKGLNAKKPLHTALSSEDPKIVASQKTSAKALESSSAKKTAEKSRNDKKGTSKDAEPEPLKGSLSPSKPKLFTPKEELVLSTEILHHVKQGVEIPVKKVDGYWDNLFDRVKERMEGSTSKERLCDKVKRMKTRYSTMAAKFKDTGEFKFRNSSDKELFGLWDQIWGSGDAMDVEHEREDSDVQEKHPKVSSPVKESKAPRSKGVAVVKDVKMAPEESEGPKSKQTEKENSHNDEDEDDDDDHSESKESDREGDLHERPTALMEVDCKDAAGDGALIPKGSTVQALENKVPSHSTSDAQKLFQEEVRATLSELQESSKQALKEWQSKALVVLENTVKAAADQSRLLNGAGVAGFDGLSNPLRCLDVMDSKIVQGDEALQQQWQELRLKELDVYRQKLELMQKECQLKQDQLKLQLRRNK